MTEREKQLMDRIGLLHDRVNEIAALEARAALVNGWAAQGHLMAEKEDLIARAEEILDKLMGKPGA